MALLNTDLFVIQRPSDANKHFKLTGEKHKEYIAAGDTIVYKGSRDFTQASQDPTTDGTGVNVGDIYINNHPNADATGAWGANISGEVVQPGDRGDRAPGIERSEPAEHPGAHAARTQAARGIRTARDR